MDMDARLAAYRGQNGRLSLTGRQYRQLDRMHKRGRPWPISVCEFCGGTGQFIFSDPVTGADATMRCPECTTAGESLDPRVEPAAEAVQKIGGPARMAGFHRAARLIAEQPLRSTDAGKR